MKPNRVMRSYPAPQLKSEQKMTKFTSERVKGVIPDWSQEVGMRAKRKAARLMLLSRLRDKGVLDGQSLQAIGDVLGVSKSTISRDLQLLEQVEAEYKRLLAVQPWLKRELTTTEFARAISADPETVRAMLRDGLLPGAYKVAGPGRGHWHIPAKEVERFRTGS